MSSKKTFFTSSGRMTVIAAAAHEQQVSLTASTAYREDDFAPACSEAVEHADGSRARTPMSPCLSQGLACGAPSGSKDEAIFIPSDSESESDGEAGASCAHRQEDRLSDRLDSNLCSSSKSTAEAAEQDHGQAEDGNESVLSDCDYEAGDRAELPRQSQSHESGDCDGSHDADSGSSSDSDGGSDGDADADYNDDGSFSDTDGEDSGRSKKRGTARSPSVTSSDNVHADDPPDDLPDDNAEENPPRPHKRQKLAHDEEDMTPVRRQSLCLALEDACHDRLEGPSQPACLAHRLLTTRPNLRAIRFRIAVRHQQHPSVSGSCKMPH
ncbi:uncharacterized protein BBA_10043 [Beauveria bassiana ARSEF 2860]|uniref:Uncharacterized protein n=1 Tax=Beauveria bassiana (strain ARSEF 2860) TaxID=655819 RepID=J4UF31_BEAB2|nr:uncharacterized protein BBA_10043 [Beauveria bassiana ARSEF 2860]EJP61007.1 hypothetical protein BBA_10043 [Beauveria bassiana ARSEF 2860]